MKLHSWTLVVGTLCVLAGSAAAFGQSAVMFDESKAPIGLFDTVVADKAVWNHRDGLALREVRIAGSRIVLDNDGSASPASRIHHESGATNVNIVRVVIDADEVVVATPIHVPGASIEIFARKRIFFENGAKLNTTPLPPATPAMNKSAKGRAGQRGGDISLHGEVEAENPAGVLLIANGGIGQQGGPGRKGDAGRKPVEASVWRCTQPCNWPQLTGDIPVLAKPRHGPSVEPTNGGPAEPGGPAGAGGAPGSVTANIPADRVSATPGAAAQLRGTYAGGAPGSKGVLYEMSFDGRQFWSTEKAGNQCDWDQPSPRNPSNCYVSAYRVKRQIVTSAGADAPPPLTLNTVDDRPVISLLPASAARLGHALGYGPIRLRVATDRMIAGESTEAAPVLEDILTYYGPNTPEHLIDIFTHREAERLAASADAGRNYFGYASYDVPRFSLEFHRARLEQSLEDAFRQLHFARWAKASARAVEDRVSGLETEVKAMAADITANDLRIARLSEQVVADQGTLAALEVRSQEFEQRLDAAVQSVMAARQNDQDALGQLSSAVAQISAVAKFVPVLAPYATTAEQALGGITTLQKMQSGQASFADAAAMATSFQDAAASARSLMQTTRTPPIELSGKSIKQAFDRGVRHLKSEGTKISDAGLVATLKRAAELEAEVRKARADYDSAMSAMAVSPDAHQEFAESLASRYAQFPELERLVAEAEGVAQERARIAASLAAALEGLNDAVASNASNILQTGAYLSAINAGRAALSADMGGFLDTLEQRALARMRLTHFQMRRALYYRTLRSDGETLSLEEISTRIDEIVAKDPTHDSLDKNAFEPLHIAYRAAVSDAESAIMADLNNLFAGAIEPGPINLELTQDNLDTLNRSGAVTLDFTKDIYPEGYEDIRILSVGFDGDVTWTTEGLGWSPPLLVVVVEHVGSGVLWRDGDKHTFNVGAADSDRLPFQWAHEKAAEREFIPAPAAKQEEGALRALLMRDTTGIDLQAHPPGISRVTVRINSRKRITNLVFSRAAVAVKYTARVN